MSVGQPKDAAYHFHWLDYAVFSLMLIASAGSGLYYAYCRKPKLGGKATASTAIAVNIPLMPVPPPDSRRSKPNEASTTTTNESLSEYLLGSRQLRSFPVAMSLIASYISGVTILGTPSEIYSYGTQYWLIVVPIYLMGWVVCTVYLPVYAKLKVTSSYEYLELRFNSTVRTLASVLFILDEIFFLPIIIYVPALAFNQVTGINVHLTSAVVCVICIIYTILGGIKAVVFTDAWQVAVMFVGVVVIVIVGTVKLNGPLAVFAEANHGGRLILFNINPSLYERHTVWSVLIGGFSYWVSFNSVNQTMVQRYMALPDERQARNAIILYTIGISMFVSVCCYAGLLVYANFAHCDPQYAQRINSADQMFPLFVMEVVGEMHGLPGLFVAGVFGAALSSLSVVLNSTAAVLLEDMVKACGGFEWTEMKQTVFVKVAIAILGVISVLLVLVIENLGGVLVVATSLSAIAAGTTFGVFTLGMLVPRSNTTGAISGMIAGALMSGWVSLGTQIAASTGAVTPHRLGVWTDECPVPGGNETFYPVYSDETNVFALNRLSFHWINPLGVLTVLVVGTIVSYATGAQPWQNVDVKLISPVVYRWLPAECFEIKTKTSRATKAEEGTGKIP